VVDAPAGADAPAMQASMRIGPAGGSVSLADGTRVEIPPGALAAPIEVTISKVPGVALPPSMTQVGSVGSVGSMYEIGPEGTEFAAPVTITLAWSPSMRPRVAGRWVASSS
jgi:hypothetical protein